MYLYFFVTVSCLGQASVCKKIYIFCLLGPLDALVVDGPSSVTIFNY